MCASARDRFINKANQVHPNKYDYSKVDYINCKLKVCIICQEHGEFFQTPDSHISGRGCPKCANKYTALKTSGNNESFIKKSIIKHGDKYDYSLVNYVNNRSVVTISCKKHNILFNQSAGKHLFGYTGCVECIKEKKQKPENILSERFIDKARKKHGNRYDYSKVKYKKNVIPVIIICKIHGEFLQNPSEHLSGCGCQKCGILNRSAIHRYNNDIFIKKAQKVHGDKYNYNSINYINSQKGVNIICPLHGEFLQLPHAHLQGRGCRKCGSDKRIADNSIFIIDKFFTEVKIIHNNKYDYSLSEYVRARDKIKIICPKHGVFVKTAADHLYGKQGCSKCAFIDSSLETFINQILTNYNISFETRTKRVIKERELDIYIPSKNLAIECHGLYWHSELQGKTRNYHLYKLNKCEEKNIRLIQIFENEIVHKPQIVANRIKNILGLTKYKIYGRKCIIKEIDVKLKNKFLDKYHIQGKDRASVYLGLFYRNRLVSVMTFGKLRKCLGQKHVEGHYELSRFCSINNFNVIGGASKLLSYFEKQYKPKYIISYADKRWSEGNLYLKLGFQHSHDSVPNYWYFNRKEHLILKHRFNFRKDVLKDKLENFDPDLTEWENMKNNKWNRVWDCGNYVFIKNCLTSA